jgi:hypothetical protein
VRPPGPQNKESILAAKILMVVSASIILTLGVLHLISTFSGPSLTPRDPALEISMSQSSPRMTTKTTMWRCWVGFNASHSLGLILFGLVFGYLALAHGQLLFRSPFLLVVGWQCLVVLLCSARFTFSVGLSEASAFLWPAMWPALRSRGSENALLMPTARWRCGTGDSGRNFY